MSLQALLTCFAARLNVRVRWRCENKDWINLPIHGNFQPGFGQPKVFEPGTVLVPMRFKFTRSDKWMRWYGVQFWGALFTREMRSPRLNNRRGWRANTRTASGRRTRTSKSITDHEPINSRCLIVGSYPTVHILMNVWWKVGVVKLTCHFIVQNESFNFLFIITSLAQL